MSEAGVVYGTGYNNPITNLILIPLAPIVVFVDNHNFHPEMPNYTVKVTVNRRPLSVLKLWLLNLVASV